MMYTLQQLLSLLLQHYDSNSQTIIIEEGIFGENTDASNVIRMWVNFQIKINGVKSPPKINGDIIDVDGVSSFLNVGNQPSQIVFGLLDSSGKRSTNGTPYFCYKFQLPFDSITKWKFSSSFKMLMDSPIDEVDYGQSTFWLSSAKLESLNSMPALDVGLNFQSKRASTTDMKLSSALSVLTNSDHIEIQGAISIARGDISHLDNLIPKFIICSTSNTLTIANFLNVPIKFAIISGIDNKGAIISSLSLLSSIIISSAPIELSVDVSRIGRAIILESNLEQASELALRDLSKFFNNTNLTSELTSEFSNYFSDIGEVIELKTVKLFIDTSLLRTNVKESLVAISAQVGTKSNKKWEIVEGYVTLGELDFTFMLNNPSSSKNLIVIVNGEFEFGNHDNPIKLVVSGSFPESNFALNSIEPFSLADALAKFLPAATEFPDLTCNNFYMSATPNKGPFSITLDVISDWAISVGVCDIAITEAMMELNYNKSNSPTTSGFLFAKATINAKSKPIDLDVNWDIPGTFALKGAFPSINLTDLSREIADVADLSLPGEFPSIELHNSIMSLTLQKNHSAANNAVYDFSMSSDTKFNNETLGLIFEVRKDSSGFGVVIGMWTENWSWSPAQQWPQVFGALLNGISFSHAGFVISSINDEMVSLDNAPITIPKKVNKGVTFFSSVDFSDSPLKLLKTFFPNATGITLYGLIAEPINNSKLIGTIGESSSTSKYSFDGLSFITDFANESFSIQTGVTFTFKQIAGSNKEQDVTLNFIGGGTIALTPPAFILYFILKVNDDTQYLTSQELCLQSAPPDRSPGWKNPLGIEGLTINNFWGQVGIEEGVALTFGFGGDIKIGDGNDQVDLELDIVVEVIADAPVIDVFKFELSATSKKSIKIVSFIKDFTELDVSKVPILDSAELKDFSIFLVDMPSGWTNPVTQTHYQMGFYSSGDVTFYGIEAVFDIEIIYSVGIKASGSVSKPISLGNGLIKISDAENDGKGPYGSIDTTVIGAHTDKPYLTLSGKVDILGISDSLYAYVDGKGFKFEVDLKQIIFKEKIICQLIDGSYFSGSVNVSVGVDANIGNIKLLGITIIPAFHLNAQLGAGISISINPGFEFEVTGSFDWGSMTISVSLSLPDITNWSDLETLIENYFVKYPEKIFAELLQDVNKWVNAVKQGLIHVGDEIATILKNAFNVVDKLAAQIMADLDYAEEYIEKALKDFWGLTEEAAKEIVEGLKEFCAMTSANSMLTTEKISMYSVKADLQKSETGSKIIKAYYDSLDGLREAYRTNQDIKSRVDRMLEDYNCIESFDGFIVEDILTLLTLLYRHGNLKLQSNIRELERIFLPYRRLNYYDLIIATHN